MAVHALSTVRASAHQPQARHAIEAEIERLIGLLDSMDGDPDLEPSLGWVASLAGVCIIPDASDLEFDESDLEPDDDGEEDHRRRPHNLPTDCPGGVALAASGWQS